MEYSTIETGTDAETGNEFCRFEKGVDDSIRFIYSNRLEEIKIVSNTGSGFVSVILEDTVNLNTPPWGYGVIIRSGVGVSISLDADEESLNKLIAWLSQHQVTVLDERHEKSE